MATIESELGFPDASVMHIPGFGQVVQVVEPENADRVRWKRLPETAGSIPDEWLALLEVRAEDGLSFQIGALQYLAYLDLGPDDALADIADRLAGGGRVARTRFYDPEGRPLVDSAIPHRAIIFKIEPYGQRLAESPATLVLWQADRLEAGKAVIVGGQTLGAVSIALSTAALEAKLVAVRRHGVLSGLLALVAGTLLALWISRSVVHPLHDMIAATESVAGGDLSFRIAVRSGDELGMLARAFNTMTARLQETLGDLIEDLF